MRDMIIELLRARFECWRELAETLGDEPLKENLEVAKSKSLQDHFWCVVGARESYTAALKAGRWTGFNCSLTTMDIADVKDRLEASAKDFEAVIAATGDWTAEREALLADLHEHEVMHEGQVIRLMYGLGRELPKSWKWA